MYIVHIDGDPLTKKKRCRAFRCYLGKHLSRKASKMKMDALVLVHPRSCLAILLIEYINLLFPNNNPKKLIALNGTFKEICKILITFFVKFHINLHG